LFYTELHNTAGAPWSDSGPFTNIQLIRYWSSTPGVVTINGTVLSAWYFWFNFADPSSGLQASGFQGFESFGGTDDNLVAWAVRSGPPHGLPEPSTVALLGIAALGGLFAARRPRLA